MASLSGRPPERLPAGKAGELQQMDARGIPFTDEIDVVGPSMCLSMKTKGPVPDVPALDSGRRHPDRAAALFPLGSWDAISCHLAATRERNS